MKRSTWKKRALASMLALAMTAGMLPMASAASQVATPKAGDESGLEMNKTATLEDDGTYTINLEAWATGETVTTVTTEPLDIVLLLDVSGSMESGKMDLSEKMYLPYTGTAAGAYENKAVLYHKCADNETYAGVTCTAEKHGVFLGSYYTYDFECTKCGWSQKGCREQDKISTDWNLYTYSNQATNMQALQLAVNSFIDSVAEKNAALTDSADKHRISLVKFASPEYKDNIGNDFNEDGYNYTQTVKNLTYIDENNTGSFKEAVNSLIPAGATAVDYGLNCASKALDSNNTDGRNKVVILFSDGEPTYGSGFDGTVASNAIKTANILKNGGATIYSIAVHADADPTKDPTKSDTANINKFFHAVSSNYSNTTLSVENNWFGSITWNMGAGDKDAGYYKTAANAGELNNIFQEIDHDVSTTKVTLDEKAVLKDIVADEFTLPANAEVTAETVECTGKDGDGNYTWAETGTSLDQGNITQSGNSISVTGFNYKEQCVVKNKDGNYSGNKLVVTIKDVEAKDAAATGTEIDTNAPGSGIYENNTAKNPVAEFVSPKTLVNKELYVLDYAKPAKLEGKTNLQPTRTHLDTDGMNRFNKENPESNLKEDYGTANLAEKALTYTPTTMDWKGYDTFYSFGKDANAQNIWSKVSVMPANNVYYEDDFMTTEDGSTVGIEYSKDNWEIVYNNGQNQGNDNTETPNNGIHGGWVEGDAGLSNDTGYSDGSAHQIKGSSDQMATASFTFTGTGVDVYTRTNNATLTVIAQLRSTEDNGKSVAKTLMVNNQSVSSDYYQIPTLTFTGLKHGTYTVTIRVTGITGTYYLDGIRVYNPIQGSDVDNAYGNEAEAVFQGVRDILLHSGNLSVDAETANGVVFIDKNANGDIGTETNEIGTYKDYGPKNEVYLDPGQSIAFKLDGFSEGTAYIGLKVPTGKETTVLMTKGEAKTDPVEVAHSTDLYYEITPTKDGLFYIENTGSNLLSITKLRTTGGTTVGEASVEALLSYANTMDTLPEVPYGNEGANGSEDGGNVDIENPNQGQETPSQGNSFLDILKDIFESIRNWF